MIKVQLIVDRTDTRLVNRVHQKFHVCNMYTSEKMVNVQASWCILVMMFTPRDWEGNLKTS